MIVVILSKNGRREIGEESMDTLSKDFALKEMR